MQFTTPIAFRLHLQETYAAAFFVREHNLDDIADMLRHGWRLGTMRDIFLERPEAPFWEAITFNYTEIGKTETLRVDEGNFWDHWIGEER